MLTDFLFRARRFAARRLGVQTAEMIAANEGERQAAPSVSSFRADHRGRYRFACRYLGSSARALDLACGVGYGASILGSEPACASVLGVDLSPDAIRYGQRHFASKKVELRVGDALTVDGLGEPFDVITSFETLEHLDAPLLLPRMHGWLADDGRLLASVPNQTQLPFEAARFPYHLRHYTPAEFDQMLNEAGFEVLELHSQHDAESEELCPDSEGLFLVAVCKKS